MAPRMEAAGSRLVTEDEGEPKPRPSANNRKVNAGMAMKVRNDVVFTISLIPAKRF